MYSKTQATAAAEGRRGAAAGGRPDTSLGQALGFRVYRCVTYTKTSHPAWQVCDGHATALMKDP